MEVLVDGGESDQHEIFSSISSDIICIFTALFLNFEMLRRIK